MRKFIKSGVIGLSLLALVLGGCGSNKSEAYNTADLYASEACSEEYYADDIYEYEADTTSGTDSKEAVTVQDTSRKLIKNVDMSVETNDMDVLLSKVSERIDAYSGYIESSYVDNGNGSYKYSRSASIRARVPAEHLNEFLNNMSEFSNITSKNLSVTDVTLQYVDVEARKDSLTTQQKRLLELMETAETTEDIITIEDRLSEIRYELESAERQLRSYDNQVNYSTISISINEVKEYTPVEEKTRFEKMTSGFLDSVVNVFEGFLDFIVNLVIALPYLVVWGIIIFIIVLIIKGIIKSSKNKEARKAAKRAKAYQKEQEKLAKQNGAAAVNTTVNTTTSANTPASASADNSATGENQGNK